MSAKYANIVNRERAKLENVLPLETPFSLFVDICNACNFKCKFCAIQYSKENLSFKKRTMDYNLFEKIIDDLSMFPEPLKMMRLTANGEPLLNKDLPKMIKLAKVGGGYKAY